jgi:hypothetical protein
MATKVRCRVRKWGNSLGIVISEDVAKKERLQAGDDVEVNVVKYKGDITDLFGICDFGGKTAQEIKDEIRAQEAKRDKKLQGLLHKKSMTQ